MRTMLCAALAAFAVLPASAAGLEKTRIDFMTPALAEGLAAVKQAAPRWTSVSMNIRASDPFYDVQDFSLRVSLRGSKSGNGTLYFNGSAGSQYLNLNAAPFNSSDPRQGYNLNGAWVNLSISRSGSSYSINGWVNHKNVWLQATPQAGGGFSLYGQMGLNLHVMGSGQGLWVTGSVDLNQYDETYLAAVGAALTVLKSMPAQ